MSDDTLKKIARQNEVIISLLGRIAFTPEKIRDIITKKKRNPDKHVECYNACNENHTVTDLAEIIGITKGTLSPILAEWEEIGIIREVERPRGRFYKKLFPI
jgi:DNA-binding MarR family transcriptional regulator